MEAYCFLIENFSSESKPSCFSKPSPQWLLRFQHSLVDHNFSTVIKEALPFRQKKRKKQNKTCI